MVAKLPPIPAIVPTWGTQMARRQGPTKMAKLSPKCKLVFLVVCLPVATSRICDLSREMMRALTVSS